MQISFQIIHDEDLKQSWMAVGGDQGAGTSKVSFDFSNVDAPNFVNNIDTIAYYNGDDSRSMLDKILSDYRDQFEEHRNVTLDFLLDRKTEQWKLQLLFYTAISKSC